MNIAICCIAREEQFYIDEFIKYHLKLGVDHIYIFQNNWRYSSNGKYRENFHVHWYQHDGEVQQLNAYNRFLHSPNMWIVEHDAVAFVDVDEYLCVRNGKSLKDNLSEYSGYLSLAVSWRLFGSSGLKFDGLRDVVTRFTKCGKSLNRHVKQIVFPKSFGEHITQAKFVNPHYGNWAAVNFDKNAVVGPFIYDNLDVIRPIELNHYVVKTYEEAKEKCARGRADCAQKRDLDAFFKEHDINEIENTTAKEFYGKDN